MRGEYRVRAEARTQEMTDAGARLGIRADMVSALIAYTIYGEPKGHFLAAVLSNKLVESFGRADEGNAAALGSYTKFLYNEMPSGSWGSLAAYESWVDTGGLSARWVEDEAKAKSRAADLEGRKKALKGNGGRTPERDSGGGLSVTDLRKMALGNVGD